MEPTYDIRELCRMTGESARTVHFYARNGLVPPAGTAGRGPRYHEGHVARLRLIRRLQREHLPLVEIRKRLEALTDGQAIRLSQEAGSEPGPPTQDDRSALAYVRSALSRGQRSTSTENLLRSHSFRSEAPPLSAPPSEADPASPPSSPSAPSAQSAPPSSADPFPLERSQWERITLAPDVELHVRRPQSRDVNRRIERLLETARGLFSET